MALRIRDNAYLSNSSTSIQLQYALGLIVVSVSIASCSGVQGSIQAMSVRYGSNSGISEIELGSI